MRIRENKKKKKKKKEAAGYRLTTVVYEVRPTEVDGD